MGLLYLMGQAQPNPRSLFASNEAGFAYDIGDSYGASEAKRTWRRNLLTWSEDLSNAVWILGAATLSSNADNAPNGTATADKLVENSATTTHYIYSSSFSSSAGVPVTWSVYAKSGERSRIRLEGGDVNRFPGIAIFDLNSGTVVSSSNGTASIESAGSGWYRCVLTTTPVSSGATNGFITLVSSGTTINYTGDGSSGVLLWGAQLEQSATPSEYQPITDFSTEFKAAYPTHSLYQDSTGITPAIYPNDPVALVLDSGRGGLANLGAELVANGGFDADASWEKGAGWTITGGQAVGTSVSLFVKLAQTPISLTVGKFYVVTYTANITSGDVRVVFTGGTQLNLTTRNASGTYSQFITPNSGNNRIAFEPVNATFTGTIDNISVKEIPGVHAYQTSSGSRPLLCRTPFSGRRNLLVRSEELVEGVGWTAASTTTTVTQNAIANPLNGQVTADNVDITDVASSRFQQTSLPLLASTQYTISGYFKNNTMTTGQTFDFRLSNFLAGPNDCIAAARINLFDGSVTDVSSGSGISGTSVAMVALSDGWYRVSVTFTSGSGAATSSAGVQLIRSSNAANFYAFGFQYELGASATAYQKVVTTTDVTEAGKADCWGLLADGVDDWLATPSISFNTWTQETRRNLLVDTESLGASTWTKTRTTVSSNVTTSPNGGLADKLIETLDAGSHTITNSSITVTSGATYTVSIYAKAAERSIIAFGGMGLFGNGENCQFDLANGTATNSGTTGNATVSIVDAGDGWYRCIMTYTATGTSGPLFAIEDSASFDAGDADSSTGPSYTGDGSSGIYIWGAQLESGTLTDYQRVGTDKMTVMAGVRKLSDAVSGVVCELTTAATNNGGIGLFAPSDSGTNSFRFISTGTLSASAGSGIFAAAPNTSVLTGIGDISGDIATLRRNGILVESVTSNQGSGNYANAVLYIGRRGGSSLPFSGILYSLIVRGTQTPTGTIRDFEKLLAKRAGVLL